MRLRRAYAGACLLLAVLTGCQSGADEAGDGADRSAASDPSTPASPDPSSSPSPTVPPAAGPLIERPTFSFRVPQGWEADYDGMDGWDVKSTSLDEGSSISVFYFEGTVESLAEAEYKQLESLRRDAPNAQVLDRIEIGGQPGFRLRGTTPDGGTAEAVGAVVNGNELTLTFEIDGTAAKSWQVIESVLATVEWR